MPFTLAHPAAVLPLLHKRLPFHFSVGLIIGSVAPDFEYFLQFRMASVGSHSLPGLFAFCLPISLLLAFAWFYVVSIPLTENLPLFLRKRLCIHSDRKPGLTEWLYFAVGSLVGGATHLLWDSATHTGGYFVNQWPLLQQPIYGNQLPLFKALQHISTIIGLAVVAFAIKNMPEQPVEEKPSRPPVATWFWLIVLLLSTFIFTSVSMVGPASLSMKNLGHIAVRTISSILLALLLACVLTMALKKSGRAS